MNIKVPHTEAETRRHLIDEALRLAGWNVDDPSQVVQELDIYIQGKNRKFAAENASPYKGHHFADYALVVEGKPVAVIEAKKTAASAELGREQALQYAKEIQEIFGGPMPFVFYTNGYETYFWEVDFYPPMKVYGFPTRYDLSWMISRRDTRRPFSVEMINTNIAGRGYQIEAIRVVLEQIEKKRRNMLLVMATGTGKTRTAMGLIDVIIRAHWAERVLFLVDRIALGEQALDAFKEFIPDATCWPLEGEKAFQRKRRAYVTTYPTMLNLIEGGIDAASLVSPHFFDVVVADESHRSIYNTYRQVLDYFHAIKIGLTATPTDRIDHDTFTLFNCDTHEPTFAYSFEEALLHQPPYLCNFEVLKVRSKFQLEGIKGGVLPPEVQRRLVAEGKDVEDIDFDGSDLERKVTNSGTNAVIVREFMEESIKDASGSLPGKTIIFAISKGHARRLQELFDKMYPEYAGNLARVMVSEDRFVYGKGGLLDQFKNQDMPRVAISVDMLDTGVDVREVVNLVFAKPVYSFVKFWQMIGRGTRVLDDNLEKRKPWCKEKDKFLIIDCWGNFEYFKMEPKGKEPGAQMPIAVKLFTKRLDKLEAAVAAGRDDIAETVKADLRKDLASLAANNVVVQDSAKLLAPLKDDSFWTSLKVPDIGYLRNIAAPVMRARPNIEMKAIRFETEVVELGAAILANNREQVDAVRASLVEQIEELPLTVNVVAEHRALIEQTRQTAFWQSASDEMLHSLVDTLAPLMKYRQRRTEAMMSLSLADLTVVKEWIEFGPEHERMSTSAYREKVEAYIRSLVEENAVLFKIASGEKPTDVEIVELAGILKEHDPEVTEEHLRKVYDHKTARFIQFIRHILGIEKLSSYEETVNLAFESFIAEHNTFTALQIRFLQTLKTFILQTGRVEKKDLIEAPFTQIHPSGVRGIFKQDEIEEILRFTKGIVA
jgi:type I restriction enzyme R subunit